MKTKEKKEEIKVKQVRTGLPPLTMYCKTGSFTSSPCIILCNKAKLHFIFIKLTKILLQKHYFSKKTNIKQNLVYDEKQ